MHLVDELALGDPASMEIFLDSALYSLRSAKAEMASSGCSGSVPDHDHGPLLEIGKETNNQWTFPWGTWPPQVSEKKQD
jgi:hypothetical protein